MIAVVVGLLGLWLALALLGLVIKGILWLTWVAACLFAATVIVALLTNVGVKRARRTNNEL
jgi:hypothetical protein